MTKCPFCENEMKEKMIEFRKGVYVKGEICPSCGEEWISEKEFDKIPVVKLERRKIFKHGGSLAIRIPRSYAKHIKLKPGKEVVLGIEGKKITVEKV